MTFVFQQYKHIKKLIFHNNNYYCQIGAHSFCDVQIHIQTTILKNSLKTQVHVKPYLFSSSFTFVTMVLHICMLRKTLDNKNENVNSEAFNFCQDSCFCKTMAKGQALQCTNQVCTRAKMPHMHRIIKQNNQQKLLFG